MYLIDTNNLIYHLNGSIPDKSTLKINDIFLNYFNISVISQMEFLGYRLFTNEILSKAKEFIAESSILGLSNEIVEQVICLKQSRSLKLPDAIIAATAQIHNLILVTRNVGDFEFIELSLYNPF